MAVILTWKQGPSADTLKQSCKDFKSTSWYLLWFQIGNESINRQPSKYVRESLDGCVISIQYVHENFCKWLLVLYIFHSVKAVFKVTSAIKTDNKTPDQLVYIRQLIFLKIYSVYNL